MPKKSNPFQKLVKIIHEQLADTTTSVKESVLVKDKHGTEVEIDVLIETKIHDHSIKLAVEARDHKTRNQTIEWINDLIGKYVDLPQINKIIAVASRDFSKEAKNKAARHGIDIVTVKEAEQKDWADLVSRITVTVQTLLDPDVRLMEIILEGHEPEEKIEWPEADKSGSPLVQIEDPAGEKRCPSDFLDTVLTVYREDYHSSCRDLPVGTSRLLLETGYNGPAFLLDSNGRKHRIKLFRIHFFVTKLEPRVSVLTPGQYETTGVAYHHGTMLASDVTLAVVNRDGVLKVGVDAAHQRDGIPLGHVVVRDPSGEVAFEKHFEQNPGKVVPEKPGTHVTVKFERLPIAEQEVLDRDPLPLRPQVNALLICREFQSASANNQVLSGLADTICARAFPANGKVNLYLSISNLEPASHHQIIIRAHSPGSPPLLLSYSVKVSGCRHEKYIQDIPFHFRKPGSLVIELFLDGTPLASVGFPVVLVPAESSDEKARSSLKTESLHD